ncbi:MAG: nucleoside-diphosphate kinase [Planctomycetes bacterium]|jgi:nucleoside-diphosphate kinase|nr:nucleoside-diphosphate kinase [Planctomycetota bacterium]
MERTLVLCKPDAVQRRIVGRIIDRFEQKGLKIVGLKLVKFSQQLAGEMYLMHKGKDFYGPLVEFVTSGPLVAMVLEGNSAIAVARKILGATFGPDADPGTIRGDFGMSKRYNVVHGSDSPESARREIGLLFDNSELIDYQIAGDEWVYARSPEGMI